MKAYVEPIVNLLYLEAEDILTVSDPYDEDVEWDDPVKLN